MTSREAFTEAVLSRLRMVLQKHERETTARAILALKKEELEILRRMPEQLPKLYELRHAAAAAAERQLAHDSAMLDAALIEFADHLFDSILQTRIP